jgi:hypothetical protein
MAELARIVTKQNGIEAVLVLWEDGTVTWDRVSVWPPVVREAKTHYPKGLK